MKENVAILTDRVHNIEMYQANIISPGLNTIEACYTDTFRRYISYTEKMEAVFEDVRMLKIVEAEHSEQLRKLA